MLIIYYMKFMFLVNTNVSTLIEIYISCMGKNLNTLERYRTLIQRMWNQIKNRLGILAVILFLSHHINSNQRFS